MELRQIRYAEAVASHRHFTRAAAAIGVAQPALSHQIKRLELELGVRLFHRDRSGVRLTGAGERFLVRARRALAELDAAQEELSALRGLEMGHVRLGAMQALAGLQLPRAIAAFHREHPGIEVTMIEESTSRMLELVLEERLDLAIVALEVDRPHGLEAEALVREPVVMALPAADPLAGETELAIDSFRHHPFVFFRPGTGLRATIEREAQRAGFIPRAAFETSDLDRLLALVAEGLGVSLIPASTAHRAPPGVAYVRLTPPLYRTVGAVWRRGRWLAPAAHAMVQLLHAHSAEPLPGPPRRR